MGNEPQSKSPAPVPPAADRIDSGLVALSPWTDLTVRYLPGEVTAALVGALVLWLPIHFLVRYRRRKTYLREEDEGR